MTIGLFHRYWMMKMTFNKFIIRGSFTFCFITSRLCLRIFSLFLEVAKVATYNTTYSGPKSAIAIGKFDNRSNYMNGIGFFLMVWIDWVINLKRFLITHLQQTGRFNVFRSR